MSDQQMTQDQRESVEKLAQSDAGVSTSDLASAGERDEDAGSDTAVGMQPRDDAPPRDDREQQQSDAERTPVMSENAAEEYRGRWQETQADFVDDPRSAVAAADALVAEVMKRVAEEFANERSGLERQWNEGGEASTEDLRVAFQRYRSFFSRLLSL